MKIDPPPQFPEILTLKNISNISTSTNTNKESVQNDLKSGIFLQRHLQVAEYSKLSYNKKICEVKKSFDETMPFKELGVLDSNKFAGFAVADHNNNVIVVFRGTLSSSLHNWCHNFNFCLVDNSNDYLRPKYHRGFLKAWSSMREILEKWLDELKHESKPVQVTLAGHSLGGAIATLAAFDLALKWSINEVVVFGCPQVGSSTFVQAYTKRPRSPQDQETQLGSCTFRYVIETDLVPRSLSWHWEYFHV